MPTPTSRPAPARRRRRQYRQESVAALEPRRLLALVLWDGTGDGFAWNDASNWQGDALPGSGDDAMVDFVPGSPNVLLEGTQTVRSFVIRGVNFSIIGGSLSAAQASSFESPLTISGGTLGGAGTVDIEDTFTWQGGVMDGGGITNIVSGVTATLNTLNPKGLGARTVNVAGTVNHTQGNLVFSQPAAATSTLNILPGGTYNAHDVVMLGGSVVGGTSTINNQGTFNKTGAGAAVIQEPIVLNNTATVNVDSGTLDLDVSTTNSGAVAVDAGATYLLDDGGAFAAGTTFPGPGLVHFRAGIHTFNSAASLPNAEFSGGVLTGAATTTFTGAFLWTGGNMTGGGTTMIAAGATATLNTIVGKGLANRTFSAAGTVNQSQGNLVFSLSAGNTSTLNILPTGVYNVLDEADLAHNFGNGTNAINNQGTFNKSGAGTNTTVSNLVPFNNTGTLNVLSGTFTPALVTQLSGNTLTAGTWNVGAGATLAFPIATAIRTNQANVSLTGANSTFNAINVLTTNNGTFKLAGGRDFTVTPNGGTLLNNGTLDLGPGSALSVAGGFSMGAGAAPTIRTTAAGTDAATQFGRVIASGDANLGGGTLTAVIAAGSPFDPPASAEFPVVTGLSRNGPFVAFNSATTPGGRLLGVRYDSANALITVRPIQPPAPDLADASDTGVLNNDDITNDTTPTLTGTADPSSTIRLYADGVQVGTVVASAAGTWSITASALAPGARVMTADSRDGFGNISPLSAGKTITIDTAAATVSAVFIDGTAWTAAFRQFLSNAGVGNETYGFRVPDGAAQLDEMPWTNLNRVHVLFSEDVSVQQADLAVRGINVANYNLGPAGNFTYNAGKRAASWTLAANVAADKILLDLDGGAAPAAVADVAGNLLDGEWANGADTFNSGNGVPGGDFRFQLNVLPGDVNRNGGVVNSLDVQQTRIRQFLSPTNLGTPPTTYTAFFDVDGSAFMNAIDVQQVRIRQFSSLPDGNPALVMPRSLWGAPTLRMTRATGELEDLQ